MSKPTKATPAPTSDYNADSITYLKYPENVRRRVSMYLGSNLDAGCFRAWKEIFDNSLDEVQAGHGNTIRVVIDTATRTFSVIDTGRGIPVGIHADTHESALVTIFTKLHAGGKFNTDTYKVSAGLNGVGAACTNAVSESFCVWTKQKGYKTWFFQEFKGGIPVYADPKKPEPAKSSAPPQALDATHGTVVVFRLDSAIMHGTIDPQRVATECLEMVRLCPGLRVELVVDGQTETLTSANGILDMVAPAENVTTLGPAFTSTSPERTVDAALSWQDDDEVAIYSYVNCSVTAEAGTHVAGLRRAVFDAVAREAGSKKIEPKHFLRGLRAALHYRMSEPVYKGQTKDRLESPEAEKAVYDSVYPALVLWFKANKNVATAIINRAERFQKNEERFREDNQAVKALKAVPKDAKTIMPDKLKQAKEWVKPHERELILVEGDSAAGTAKAAALDWQEVLPLRGKFLNVQRTTFATAMANKVVQDIIQAMGGWPNAKTPEKARVGSISFLTDADHDGSHIQALLMGLFTRYFPEWLRAGKVNCIDAPLFSAAYKDERHYGNTVEECLEQFPKAVRSKALVTRAKGWGEVGVAHLREIAMEPTTRRLCRLVLNDEDEVDVVRIMGDDIAYRKELLGIDLGNNDESSASEDDGD